MVKSLILSALLSFGTVSYEFDSSEFLQNRTAPVENIDYSRIISFTIDNSESANDLIIDSYGDLSSNLMIDYAYQDFINENLIISFDSDFYSAKHFYTSLTTNYEIGFYTEAEDSFKLIYSLSGEFDYFEGDFSDESESGLLIESGDIFQYSGEGADILYQVFVNYVTSYELSPESNSLISEIGEVLLWVPTQFVSLFSTLTAVFYSNGALTLSGLFLVISLGVFVCALILDFILKFRKI